MKNIFTNFYSSSSIVASFVLMMVFFAFVSCDPKPPQNSRVAQAERGKAHFEKYCLDCHGNDGKGIVIDSMDVQPKDLTTIMDRRKVREFPILQIARIIDGRNMSKSHGSRDMPFWGEVFEKQEYLNEAEIKGKMGEIIAYLMSIQE